MDKLKISEIYFGKIDGYNEFLEYGEDACMELFFEFPNIQISKLLDGSKYYILGNKGTGKTMLLKYLESRVLENPEVVSTEFLRFKRDIDAEQRNQIKRAAIPNHSHEEVIGKDIPMSSEIKFSLAWQVYLIKVVVNRIAETEQGVFERDNENWVKLLRIIAALYGDDKSVGIKRIVPKMKRGNVELKLAGLGKISLELEWVDEEKHTVAFTSIAKVIISLYSKLRPANNKLYIFIDELELSLKKGKDYQRDVLLIRDLIFAIEYLNDIHRTNGYQVYIIAAIRSEVYKNVISKGMEINKTISDFGVTISWEQKGGDIRQHPLLKMLEKRIHFSEKSHGIKECDDIRETYFTPYISIGQKQKSIENYILDQTWFKPRDVIRLFTLIQERYGNKSCFDQEVFQTISKAYSEESWIEFEETLTVKYSDVEVEGIRQALTGLELPFNLEKFQKQIMDKADFFEGVRELQKRHKPGYILKDLYEIGIIGNYGENPRFSFKGDMDIDPRQPLTIHYPLIRYFRASISSKR